MAVRRNKIPVRRTKAGSRAGRISTQTNLYVSGAVSSLADGGHVGRAAEIIAQGIRRRAAAIPSMKIPPGVTVGSATPRTATIYAHGQPAVIIETGGRHPLFGLTGKANDRRLKHIDSEEERSRRAKHKDFKGTWKVQERILFMEEGAALALDDAAAEYGKTVDDWLARLE